MRNVLAAIVLCCFVLSQSDCGLLTFFLSSRGGIGTGMENRRAGPTSEPAERIVSNPFLRVLI
jgi:hypothetical protein